MLFTVTLLENINKIVILHESFRTPIFILLNHLLPIWSRQEFFLKLIEVLVRTMIDSTFIALLSLEEPLLMTFTMNDITFVFDMVNFKISSS